MTLPGPVVGLRRTEIGDLDRVCEIETGPDTAAWLGGCSYGWHAGALADPDREHLLVVHEGRTAGFVVLAAPRGTEEGVELRRIVIASELRARGLGRAALRATLAVALAPTDPASCSAPGEPPDPATGRRVRLPRWAAGAGRVWLDVKPDNVRALALYASEGFTREQELPTSPGEPDGPVALVILARSRERG